MKDFLNKPIVKKALTWLIVIAVGTVVLLTQFISPVILSYGGISFYSVKDSQTIKNNYDSIMTACEKAKAEQENPTTTTAGENGILPEPIAKNYSQILSESKFDFSDSSKYIKVVYNFHFANIGMYKISDVQFTVTAMSEYADRFVYKESNSSSVNRFAGANAGLSILLYIDGLNNEEVGRALSGLSVSYSYDRPELFPSGGVVDMPQSVVFQNDMLKAE